VLSEFCPDGRYRCGTSGVFFTKTVSGLKQHLDALYTEQNQHKKKIVMKFMFVMQTLYDILLLGKLSIVEVIRLQVKMNIK
jgi:hypothetical protein